MGLRDVAQNWATEAFFRVWPAVVATATSVGHYFLAAALNDHARLKSPHQFDGNSSMDPDVGTSPMEQDFLDVPDPLPPIPEGVERWPPRKSQSGGLNETMHLVTNQIVGIGMFGRAEGATDTELKLCCERYSGKYAGGSEKREMKANTLAATKNKIKSEWRWKSSETPCEIEEVVNEFRGIGDMRQQVYRLKMDVTAEAKKQPDTLPPDEEESPAATNLETSMQATNTILYGPPGTGKTYKTAELAVKLCNGSASGFPRKELMVQYEALRREGRISFVTFHQSYGYEDFVEGLRPEVIDGQVAYSVRPGVFREVCAAAKRSQLERPRLSNKPFLNRKIFKMSLGVAGSTEGNLVFQDSISNGVILLGWGGNVDFTHCANSAAIAAKVAEFQALENPESQARYMNVFKEELKEGDIVVVSQGNTAFRAIGEVVGEYEYLELPAGGRYHQSRAVRWIAVFEGNHPVAEIYNKNFMQSSLYKLQPEHMKLGALEALIRSQSGLGRQDFVLVIDEINRANISKVFGELITLLEPDKREGEINAVILKLPYSGKEFSVPPNLHIIGTMNTADRSIALLDSALRRRFDFEELEPRPSVLAKWAVPGVDMVKLLTKLNERIEALYDRDHRIGHAFFIGVESLTSLEQVFRRKVIPLLQEYFYENLSDVRRALNDYGSGEFITKTTLDQLPQDGEESFSDEARVAYRVNDTPFPVTAYQRIYSGN